MKEDPNYCPTGFADVENEDGTVILGNWRANLSVDSMFHNDLTVQNNGRPTSVAEHIRNHLSRYFSSPEGSLSWQNSVLF
jgi:hypothetical protein